MTTDVRNFEAAVPALFERALLNEPSSVARIVWYVLKRSHPANPLVPTNYDELQRELNLSRCAVRAGLQRAVTAGYLFRHHESAYSLALQNSNSESENQTVKEDTEEVTEQEISYQEQESENQTVPEKAWSLKYESENQTVNYASGLSRQESRSYRKWNLAGQASESEKQTTKEEAWGQVSWSEKQTANYRSGKQTIKFYQSAIQTYESENNTLYINSNRIENIESLEDLESKAGVVCFADSPQSEKPTEPLPTYLARLAHDFSHELGDIPHVSSNRSQIRNLWQASGLSERDFSGLMYEARSRTRRFATLRAGEQLPPNGQPRNRMAYYFTVLRNLLFGEATPPTATVPARHERPRYDARSPQNSGFSEARSSSEKRPPNSMPASWLRAMGKA